MKIFDRYLLKHLSIATAFIAVVLTVIIFLTQSLRFLEIVMNAGSSGTTFWILTTLALPRFFEVILPLSLMAATVFIYNKLILDSELIAMRGMGHSSFNLATPALMLAGAVTVILWIITMWIAPISLAKMQEMRVELKAEFSNFLFKEGVFNDVGKGLTVYISEKRAQGELAGLMIHDTRDSTQNPSTIFAKRGKIIATQEGHQVIVYSGARQSMNPKTGVLQNLEFDQYTIDLPDNQAVRTRWAEPDERTIVQLLNPDPSNKKDLDNMREFNIEIHRRLTSPLLAFTFPLIALLALLLGPIDRRGQVKKIAASIVTIIIIQGLFLASYNLATKSNSGLVLMYLLTLLPITVSLLFLSGWTEEWRRKLLYSGYKKDEDHAYS